MLGESAVNNTVGVGAFAAEAPFSRSAVGVCAVEKTKIDRANTINIISVFWFSACGLSYIFALARCPEIVSRGWAFGTQSLRWRALH